MFNFSFGEILLRPNELALPMKKTPVAARELFPMNWRRVN
jgi:hypothetical protein